MKILSIAALCMVSLLGTSSRAQDIILLNQDGEEVGVAKDVEQKKAAAAPQVKQTQAAETPADETATIKDGIITVTGADGKVLQQFKLSEARSVSISRSTRSTASADGSTIFTENLSTATLIGPDGVRREIELDADRGADPFGKKTEVPKSWMIGVSSEPASEILRSQLKLDDMGLVVKRVLEDGAAKTDLKANDIILFADQKPIGTRKDLADVVNEAGAAGNKVSLTVLRGGEEVSVSVTPVERELAQVPRFFEGGFGGLDPGIDFGGLDVPEFGGHLKLPQFPDVGKQFDQKAHREMLEKMQEQMQRIEEQMAPIEGAFDDPDWFPRR